MSALTGICGWPRFRWPPLLPVHIHLTIESGKRKPSGECPPWEKAHHPARRTRHIWLRFRFWVAFFPQHEEQGGIVPFFLFEILSIRIFLKKLADILKFHLLF